MRSRMRILPYFGLVLVVACAWCATPFIASAHVTGSSWEIPVGKYTADIGYDPITFTAGVYTRFDFNLWVGTTTTDANGIVSGTPADFSQVWVRVLSQNSQETLLATGIWKQPIGPTTLLYEFTLPGSYKLEASFRDADGNDIAVVPTSITVSAAGRSIFSALGIPLIALVLGAACGAGCTYVVWRKRSR